MTIRVILAEDNLLVREGVRRLLETRRGDGIEVVAACGDLPTLLDAVDAPPAGRRAHGHPHAPDPH